MEEVQAGIDAANAEAAEAQARAEAALREAREKRIVASELRRIIEKKAKLIGPETDFTNLMVEATAEAYAEFDKIIEEGGEEPLGTFQEPEAEPPPTLPPAWPAGVDSVEDRLDFVLRKVLNMAQAIYLATKRFEVGRRDVSLTARDLRRKANYVDQLWQRIDGVNQRIEQEVMGEVIALIKRCDRFDMMMVAFNERMQEVEK